MCNKYRLKEMAQIIIKIDDEKKKIIEDTAKSEYLSLSAFTFA